MKSSLVNGRKRTFSPRSMRRTLAKRSIADLRDIPARPARAADYAWLMTSHPPTPRVPEKITLDGLEDKWVGVWAHSDTYRFDRTKTRDQIYSIDTPPPT